MKSHCSTLLLIAALAVALARPAAARGFSTSSRCPPPFFDAVQDFDLILHRRKVVPIVYTPRSNLYCVFAKYEKINGGLLVNNYSNKDRVNGEVAGTSEAGGPRTIATIPDPSQPSKLRVGISFNAGSGETEARILGRGGPYWVVALGQSADAADRSPTGYDWAIVSAGAPTRPTADGCSTGSRSALLRRVQTNGNGLWLFSRKPVDTANTQVMMAKLADLGIDGSELLDVQQAGCQYL